MTSDLFPKPPRRMRQPAKCVLREQLVLAADELIAERERAELWKAAATYVHSTEPIDFPAGMRVERVPPDPPEPPPERLMRSPGGLSFPVESPRVPWWRRLFRRDA